MKYISLILVCLFLTACRKAEEYTRPDYHYSPSSTPVVFKDPPLFHGICSGYGFFTCTRIFGGDSSTPATMRSKAYISNIPLCFPLAPNCIHVKRVDLNGIIFKNTDYFYEDSSGRVFQPPLTWTCDGNEYLSPVSYTYTEPFPDFPAFFSLPDTIPRNQAWIIWLDKLSFSQRTLIQLTDGTNSAGIDFGDRRSYFPVTVGALQKFKPNSIADFYILCSRGIAVNLDGKPYCFSNNTIYRKTVFLVD